VRLRSDAGLTLVELLVGLAVFAVAVTAFASLVVGGAKLNKSQQMAISAQSNARNCVSIIEQALRTAGWDPRNAGFAGILLQSPATAADNWIEVFADLDEDGTTTGPREDMTFRLNGTTLEWRTSSSGSFETLAPNITNDADGDGTPELMFTPDSVAHPTRITVKVTARSSAPDPRTGHYIRATVSTQVVLRNTL
jgi:prepilin-type N-terminal cleavage/methylation domain-containing protein